jgi:hypothetical protein
MSHRPGRGAVTGAAAVRREEPAGAGVASGVRGEPTRPRTPRPYDMAAAIMQFQRHGCGSHAV